MPPHQARSRSAGGIEKTRREVTDFPPTVAPPRGVLHAAADRGAAFFHQRLAPPPEFAPFLQHFWYVQWDRRNAAPSTAETLPHPNCYLIFEHDLERPLDDPSVHRRAQVAGVTRGKFERIMENHGRVFGLKFQPGGLRPFLGGPVSALTGRVVHAPSVFGSGILHLATQLRTLDDPESMAMATTTHFNQRLPAPDPNVALSTSLVQAILRDSAILSVETLSRHSGLSLRSLQRLFKEYVGVSPKWVIRRFRLHEVLERLHSGGEIDGAQLALDLGYADQAHLINDFRKLAGSPPVEYLRRTLLTNPGCR